MTRAPDKRGPACAAALAAGMLVALALGEPSWAAPGSVDGAADLATPNLATPGPVRDLYYGEALFQFYQDKHFDALTHLLVARAGGRVQNQDAESELLLGGLYLHYGQHIRAEQIFNRLLTREVAPSVRDRAWFYLGKVRYQRGLNDEALAAFARISGALPEGLAAELPLLEGQALMAVGRFDAAAALLDGWKGPESWAPYARYNLGVAFVRMNRLADGARQLDRVGRGSPASEELLDLRDKANLALGYAWLQGGREGEARPVLERVRLESPFASKALLGVGWADAAAHNYRQALTPWLELRDRDLLDSAVQESLLAIPYAYAELDAHGSAAEGYQSALQSFDAEIAHLDQAIIRAESGGLIPALLASDDPGIGHWYWELKKLPDSDEGRYLYLLIADHRFQEGLRNVRDLNALSTHLQEWQEKLAAFADVVANRRQALAQREPKFSSGLDRVDLVALKSRRDALASRLDDIESHHDVAGLGTAGQLDHWQRLERVGAAPALAAPGASELRERQRLLRGVMLWDLDRDYQYRLWLQRRNLAEIDRLLADAARGRSDAVTARRDSPAALEGFAERIAAATPRIARMQQLIARVSAHQEQQLQALAVDTLGEQRERLGAYRVQAQFALATIYDRAATAARVMPARKPGSAP